VTEQVKHKMQEFLGKLWMNPSLQKTSLSRKENQILMFLKENQAQLQKIFAQQDYFPQLSWDEAVRLLLNELVEKLLATIDPAIGKICNSVLSSDLLNSFVERPEIDPEKFKNFLVEQMRVKSLRDQLLSAIQIISLKYYDNYLPIAIERRKYTYNELVRHDHLSVDTPLLPSFFALVTLFRPMFYQELVYKRDSGTKTSMAKSVNDKSMFEPLMKSLKVEIYNKVGMIPDFIINAAVHSNLPIPNDIDVLGTGKLIAIMAARSADYIPTDARDRGAESPDKSWFQINRRNAKLYGLDGDMIDELYQISGEQGW